MFIELRLKELLIKDLEGIDMNNKEKWSLITTICGLGVVMVLAFFFEKVKKRILYPFH